ncbi:hypothetical protein [Pseudomonas syringae]|uniref:hypothetical protein n=1 Tax=Pseudomonas syringae TaxID=317 RepID=UPI001F0E3B29|nr:hypothetical protein [Pseudomonas syringae]MCH5520338.1 hypothetical protein [Pseudomonas syringae pv. lapsa]
MFKTHEADMVGVPGLFGEGQYQWRQVSRILRTHWYHVTLQATQEGRISEAALMVDTEHQLQQLLIAQDEEIAVTDVQVVTPPWMNRCDSWGMDRVVKVTVGHDKVGCDVCLIEIDKGIVYHSSHRQGFQIESLKNLRPVFLKSMIRSA